MRTAMLILALAVTAPVRAEDGYKGPGPIATADHVSLNVADPDTSARFYRTAFGMTELPTEQANTHWLAMGSVQLHLIGAGRKDRPTERIFTHLALRSADLDKTIAWFDANGIPWRDVPGKRAIQPRFDGVRQIFVQDPDGYWIEVNDAREVATKR